MSILNALRLSSEASASADAIGQVDPYLMSLDLETNPFALNDDQALGPHSIEDSLAEAGVSPFTEESVKLVLTKSLSWSAWMRNWLVFLIRAFFRGAITLGTLSIFASLLVGCWWSLQYSTIPTLLWWILMGSVMVRLIARLTNFFERRYSFISSRAMHWFWVALPEEYEDYVDHLPNVVTKLVQEIRRQHNYHLYNCLGSNYIFLAILEYDSATPYFIAVWNRNNHDDLRIAQQENLSAV